MKNVPTDWTVEVHAHNRALIQIEGTVTERGESHRRVLFYGFDDDAMAKLVCAAPKMAKALGRALKVLEGEDDLRAVDEIRAALKEAGQ